jgi:hypothetical protein
MAILRDVGGALFSIIPEIDAGIFVITKVAKGVIKQSALKSFGSCDAAVNWWVSLTFISTFVFLQQPSSFLSTASVLQSLQALLLE